MGNSSNYLLMHKDEPVISFEIDTGVLGENIIKNERVLNERLIPLALQYTELSGPRAITTWLERRKIPLNRKNFTPLVKAAGLQNASIAEFTEATKLVSLNDIYWVKKDTDEHAWRNISPYRNTISKLVAETAFTGGDPMHNKDNISPEYTTDGALPKCWVRETSGKIKLYKGSSSDIKEAFNEFICYQVELQMGLKGIGYDLKKYKNKLVSSCECMCDEEFGLVKLGEIWNYSLSYSSIKIFLESIISSTEVEKFDDMLFFDSVVLNPDRHANNIGFRVNNETNKILGLTRIYDNGCALYESNRESISAFKASQNELFEYLITPKRVLMLRNIHSIKQHKVLKMDTEDFRYKASIIDEAVEKAKKLEKKRVKTDESYT